MSSNSAFVSMGRRSTILVATLYYLLLLANDTSRLTTTNAFAFAPMPPPRQQQRQVSPTFPFGSPFKSKRKAMMLFNSINDKDDNNVNNDASLEQRPGESDLDFIKRITCQSQSETQPQKTTLNSTNNSTEQRGSGSTYQRIEEWDAERQASGELTWEEKVQFDGQRFGNQVKQQWILEQHIGTFWRK